MPIGDSKTCTKCGADKPLSEYYFRDGGPIAACKVCTKAKVAAYQKANPELRAKWGKARRARNQEYERTRQARWQQGAGREKYLATRKRHRERNKAKLAAAWAAYYETHRDELAAKSKAYREAFPEKKRAARNSEGMRLDRERRRARLLAAYVEDTPFDTVLQRDQGICGICNQPIMEATIELDHIIPLAAGGMHELKNVQVAHRTCNRRKSARANFTLTVTG